MPIATNPDTGETVFLDVDGQWKPARTAQNPETGQSMAFDGSSWVDVQGPAPEPAKQELDPQSAEAMFGPQTLEPWQRASIEAMKKGAGDMARGVGLMEMQTPEEKAAYEAATRDFPGQRMLAEGGTQAIIAAPAMAFPPAQSLAGAGVIGALEGGIAARGAGGDVADIGIASTIGAVAPGVLELAGRGAKSLMSVIPGVRNMFNEGVTDNAIAKALANSDLNIDQVAAKMEQMGPEAAMVDVSEALTDLGVASMVKSSSFSPQAERMLNRRASGVRGRVIETANKLTGSQGDFYKSLGDLTKRQKAVSDRLYGKAREKGARMTPEIQAVLARADISGDLLENAQTIARMRGDELGDTILIDASGKASLGKEVNFDTFDAIKRSLDAKIEPFRDGTTGRLNMADPKIEAMVRLRRDFVDAVDEVNPAYAKARKAYADEAANLDAMKQGRDFMRGDPEILEQRLDRMSDTERAYFMDGVSRKIEDMVDNNMNPSNVVKQLLGKEKYQKALRVAFENDADFLKFKAFLQKEARFAETKRKMMHGSPTADKLGKVQNYFEDPDLMQAAMVDVAMGAPLTTMAKITNFVRGKSNELTPKQMDKLSVLINRDPSTVKKTVNEMLKRNKRRAARLGRTRAGLGLAGGAVAGETEQ